MSNEAEVATTETAPITTEAALPADPTEGAGDEQTTETAAPSTLSTEDVRAILNRGNPEEIMEALGWDIRESSVGAAHASIRRKRKELREETTRTREELARSKEELSAEHQKLSAFRDVAQKFDRALKEGGVADAIEVAFGRSADDVIADLIAEQSDPAGKEARRLRKLIEDRDREASESARKRSEEENAAKQEAEQKTVHASNHRILSQQLTAVPGFEAAAEDPAFREVVLNIMGEAYAKNPRRTPSAKDAAEQAKRLLLEEADKLQSLFGAKPRSSGDGSQEQPSAARGNRKLPAGKGVSDDRPFEELSDREKFRRLLQEGGR